MARNFEPAVVSHLANLLLTGKMLTDAEYPSTGPAALIFRSLPINPDETRLTITTKAWFDPHYVVEEICSEEHEVNGRLWGRHISAHCPQFRQRVEQYRDKIVRAVSLDGNTLVVEFEGELRLFLEDDSAYVDDGGWEVWGRAYISARVNSEGKCGAYIPDEVDYLLQQPSWEGINRR